MRERLNAEAREVVGFAEEEALAAGHGWVGTEHLLLGLLRSVEEGRSGSEGTGRLLEPTTLVRARGRVLEFVPPETGSGAGTDATPTPRAKRVLEHSALLAPAGDTGSVGREHLLLGLLWETEGVGARILAESGLHYGDAAAALSVPVSRFPDPPDDAPLGPKVDVTLEELEVLLEGLPRMIPRGCPLGFNLREGGRGAWIALGEGVDAEAYVREALAR